MVSLLALVPALAVGAAVLSAVGRLKFKLVKRGRHLLVVAGALAFGLAFAGTWGLTSKALSALSPAPLLIALPALVVVPGLCAGAITRAGGVRWSGGWWWWSLVPVGLAVLAELVLAPLAGVVAASDPARAGLMETGRAVLWDLALLVGGILVPPALSLAAAAPSPLRAGSAGVLAAFLVAAIAAGPVVPAFAAPVTGDLDLADQRIDLFVTPEEEGPYRVVVPLPVAARDPAPAVRAQLLQQLRVVQGTGEVRLVGDGTHAEVVADGPVKVAAWTYFLGTSTHRESLRAYAMPGLNVTASAVDGASPPPVAVRLEVHMSAGLLQGCDLDARLAARLPGTGTAPLTGSNTELVPRCG